jgi:pyruvyltransferase
MNLAQLYRKATKKPLKVYWWRYDYPKQLNFGDELTPYIIERLFNRKVVWADPADCQIAGAGSIIEILQELSGGNPIKVWGSGFIKPGSENTLQNLRFSAVRGKLSRDRVNSKDIALGDPGLLMPLVFSPDVDKKYRLGVIPHYVDQGSPELAQLRDRKDVKVINILDSVENVIKDMLSCELIISSSMHGLIVSDAYGVPNYWMPFSDDLTGSDYKFKDYYSVYGAKPAALDSSMLGKLKVDQLINSYQPKAGLEDIQQGLIKAFPFLS